MRTEQFENAINDIHSRVKELVMNQLPTLDGIMQVDKMSPEDRVFYEAYKKYGNRNHTWQDFKAIFNGDIATMQKTVKHWKTWDEINDFLSQAYDLVPEIKRLKRKYNLKSIKEFKQYPDLAAVYEKCRDLESQGQPNYSTFNPQVAKLEQEFEKKAKAIDKNDKKAKIDLVVEYIKKFDEYIDLTNGNFVIGERIELYRKIILQDQQILEQAKNFDNLSAIQKIDLARMILNKSAKITGTPTGRIIQDDAIGRPHVLEGDQTAGYAHEVQEFLFRAEILERYPLALFLKDLAHEDAHRIDYHNAEYGMIGTQLMKFVEDNYLNNNDIDVELYKKFATEQSSYYMHDTVAAALHYNIKYDTKDR